jgi:prophage antirepressor-like protein
MYKSIKIFKHDQLGEVRVVTDEAGESYFCLVDVCKILVLDNPSYIVKRLKEREVVRINLNEFPSLRLGCDFQQVKVGNPITNFITESGLYRVIMRSDSSNASDFQDWVFEEVLPSIRKTGRYELTPAPRPTIPPEELEVRKIEAQAKLKVADAKIKELDLKEIGILEEIKNRYPNNKEFSQILDSHITEKLSGKQLLELPTVIEKTYSATDIGNMLGFSANRIGKTANALNLKHEKGSEGIFGKWVADKAKYTDKAVETFRYNQKGFDKIKGALTR